jgi:hypothetical protein
MLFVVFAFVALISLFVVLLLVIGGVNGRREDEYWAELWQDTPTTDVDLITDDPVSKNSTIEVTELPKAA